MSDNAPRRQLRFSNAAWIILAVVPLLTWLVLAAQIATYDSPAPSNTDSLFDKFMARIALEVTETRQSSDFDCVEKHELPDAELLSWEGEFGGDPRYWMLCYYFAEGPLEDAQPVLVSEDLNRNVYFLEEARRRGVADAQIMMELFWQHEWAWRCEADNKTRAWLQPGEGRRESNLLIWRYVDEHYGEECEALFADVLEVAGDHSWPYYEAALIESERGNLETAWELVKQGNAAPVNRALVGFPFDVVYEQFWTGQPLDDRIAGGIVCDHGMRLPLLNYIRYKEMVKQLIEDARAREDLAALTVLNTFACRFGAMENTLPIQALVSKVMIDYVYDAASQNWPVKHSAAQRLALSQLQQKSGNIVTAVRQLNMKYPRRTYLLGVQGWLKHPEIALGGSLGINVDLYQSFHDAALLEYSTMGMQIAPGLAEAEQFDYATLSWPEK